MLGKLLRHFQEITSLISVAPCKAFAGHALNNEIDSVGMSLLSIQVRGGQVMAMVCGVLRTIQTN
ncbi:hypothetical protein AX13_17085 [Comamonas aquatica DA1877]|uniref:Uncharacterized protein n=1 Tax=Comamonas aquatica DA1877 TaxID=1457173 RepID=A0A014NLP9_9BURK|nr:hypothetical protein [Comamonas aquatica]EXU80408.1 hypothetical protein AX13_17085 [Comamonas aquatica DA1877]